jgi:hypothetical protein
MLIGQRRSLILAQPGLAKSPGLVPPSTGLWGWWHAGEAYAETSGNPSNPVTSTGQSVGSLKDMSGNGRHMYQATEANKWTLKNAAIGACPALSNRVALGPCMATTSAPAFDRTYSIYGVFQFSDYITNAALFGTDNNSPGILLFLNGSDGDLLLSDASGAGPGLNFAMNMPHMLGGSWSTFGNNWFLAKNGEASVSAAASFGSGTGLGLRWGNFGSSPGNSFMGEIAEILFYDVSHGNPNAGDGLLARRYLNLKYNLGYAV